MTSNKKKDLSEKIQEGLNKARRKLIEEEKKRNGYLIVADKNGAIKKIAAKDL